MASRDDEPLLSMFTGSRQPLPVFRTPKITVSRHKGKPGEGQKPKISIEVHRFQGSGGGNDDDEDDGASGNSAGYVMCLVGDPNAGDPKASVLTALQSISDNAKLAKEIIKHGTRYQLTPVKGSKTAFTVDVEVDIDGKQ